jgi:hypothetical protein
MDRWRDRVESISQESAEERQQKLAKDSLKFCDRYSSEVSSLHHYCVKLSVLRYSSEVSSLHHYCVKLSVLMYSSEVSSLHHHYVKLSVLMYSSEVSSIH